MFKKPYYYGDGTDHIVYLTKEEADAVNGMQISDVIETDDGMYVKTNLKPNQIKHYNRATDILNRYLEDHEVTWNDTSVPVLRPKR